MISSVNENQCSGLWYWPNSDAGFCISTDGRGTGPWARIWPKLQSATPRWCKCVNSFQICLVKPVLYFFSFVSIQTWRANERIKTGNIIRFWVPKKLPQIYTVISYTCIWTVACFAVYICGIIWNAQYFFFLKGSAQNPNPDSTPIKKGKLQLNLYYFGSS